ncbi:MAG TPA: shikimate kinase [Acidimicrobiales bacterium]|nr:shikimate kinase [Acidimicrobiales bacterium]
MAKQAIVLIGMPGSGKTRVGQALAQLLNWRWVDVDALVADDVPAFIEREGIDAFRARERAVIAALTPQDSVVSVGGGAILDPANRENLRALGPVVWLRASLATLVERVGSGEGRPLLQGDPAATLPKLLEERTPIYEAVATIAVDVDGRDAFENAGEVMKALTPC